MSLIQSVSASVSLIQPSGSCGALCTKVSDVPAGRTVHLPLETAGWFPPLRNGRQAFVTAVPGL